MTATKWRLLVALTVVSAAIGWAVVIIVDGLASRILPVPWLAGATMWLLAIALLFWTLLARPRLQRKPGVKPMDPLVAARTAALAMAASRTGAIIAGVYLGVMIGTFDHRDVPAGQSTLWAALATASGAVAVTGVAMWLERICRIKSDDDDQAVGSAS